MLHVRLGSSRVLICLLALLVTPAAARAQLVTAPGAGVGPLVRVIETNGTERVFHAYHPAFTGGVRVALGDVTGDGVLDIVTAPGPGGGPHVRVWNGVDLTEVGGFFAYDPAFSGGVWVAAGDVDGDGRADIITGAGAGGGPHVRVWSGTDFHEIGGFFAYHPAFGGGVTVAAGDVNGDGRADIITGAGPGGGPHVRVWNATNFAEIGGFFAYHPAFAGGVSVAAGDVNNDGRADIITGAGPGGGPHVRVWNATNFAEIGGFFAYDPGFSGGVNVAAIDLTGDGRAEVITGLGPGGFPISSIWNGADLSLLGSYLAFDPSLRVGVFVASVGKSSALGFTSASTTSFTRGAAGTFTVTTAGGATPPALTVAGALPGGVQFTDNGDGTATLAGTPVAGTAGTYSLTFTANNGSAPPVTQAFTLVVNDAPAITSANSASFNVGSLGSSFTITTTGTPTPAISIAGALPGGITFTDNGNGTATLGGTASAGTGGTYPLAITATNGIGAAAVQNFTLSIQQGAAITSGNATTFVAGAAATFTVTTTGSPAATSITHTGALPSGVSFTNNGNGTATLAGMPGATTGGTYPLTITASNGVGSPAVQNFTLTVNQAPAITSASTATFVVGAPGTFAIATTGFPTATISATTLPAGLTFADNGNGNATIAGTPDAGTGGTYSATITASNGVGTAASQTLTLTVQQAPAITSANSATFTVGAAGTFTVTAAGFPVPSLTRGGVALPSGVTFADNGNGTGTLAGTPDPGTGGTYAISFTATNAAGSVGQPFTLTVQQPPAITSANGATFTVGAPGSFTVTTTGIPAPSIARTGDALPGTVTFADNLNGTGTLSGTASGPGTFNLIFTASNGVGSPAVQNFTLTAVCPVITLTPAGGALAAGAYGQAYSQSIAAVGGGLHAFTITAGALPSGIAMSPGGVISGPPTNTGTFSFTVTATESNSGCSGSASYSIQVSPNAVDETYSGGVGNTQIVVSPAPFSSTPAVLVVGSVLGNDAGPGALSAGPAIIASTSGGSVALGASGAFVYTPVTGFAGPSDTFVYTLTDGNGLTDTATVTVNLSGIVWYVNNSGPNGDGRSHLPFNALNNAQTPSSAGDVIFVHAGVGSTPGAITLKTSQTLWGNAHAFSLNSLSIAGAGTPVLSGSVTLANGVLVRALDISSGAAEAIVGSNLTGTETIETVNIVGGVTGLNLTNVGGTFNFNNGSITNVVGTDVRIIGGDGTISINSPITNTAGRSVDIENRSGGSVGFTRRISDTDQGILLGNNGTAPVLFLGGLALDTGANPAFTATGGGRVSAIQDNSSIVNTITTTTGTAINLTDYSIGTLGVTFRSISANGAVNGIVLDNTGINSFTVTGNGTPGSGGTIQDTSGPAVLLNTTGGVSLSRMIISASQDDGVRGTTVNGFSLIDSSVANNGNTVGEAGLDFTDLTGTSAFTNATVTGSAEDNVVIRNSSGALTLTVTGSTFGSNSAIGNDGLLVDMTQTASVTVSVTGSTFTANRGDHFQTAFSNSASGTVTFTGNVLSGGHVLALGQGITINAATGVAFGGYTGTVNYTVSNNTIDSAILSALTVNLGTSGAAGTFSGRIENNQIGSALVPLSCSAQGNGIQIDAHGNGTHTSLVNANTIRNCLNQGIGVQANDGGGVLNLTVTDNTVDVGTDVNTQQPFFLNAGSTSTNVFGLPDSHTVCLAMTGNTLANGPFVLDDFRVRQRFDTTFRLPGYGGAADDTAAVVAFIAGNNPVSTGSATTAFPTSGAGFVGGAGCTVPIVP